MATTMYSHSRAEPASYILDMRKSVHGEAATQKVGKNTSWRLNLEYIENILGIVWQELGESSIPNDEPD